MFDGLASRRDVFSEPTPWNGDPPGDDFEIEDDHEQADQGPMADRDDMDARREHGLDGENAAWFAGSAWVALDGRAPVR